MCLFLHNYTSKYFGQPTNITKLLLIKTLCSTVKVNRFTYKTIRSTTVFLGRDVSYICKHYTKRYGEYSRYGQNREVPPSEIHKKTCIPRLHVQETISLLITSGDFAMRSLTHIYRRIALFSVLLVTL